MIRTGEEYRAGLRDGREVWIDGERVQDVTVHPAFKPVVDFKARMYDMAHEPAWAEIMSYREPALRRRGVRSAFRSCCGRRPKRRTGTRSGAQSTPI